MVTAADDPNLEKRSDGKTSQLVCWPFPAPCTPGKNNQIINYDATTGHLPHQGDLAANCRRSYGIPYLLLAHNGTAGRDGFRVPPRSPSSRQLKLGTVDADRVQVCALTLCAPGPFTLDEESPAAYEWTKAGGMKFSSTTTRADYASAAQVYCPDITNCCLTAAPCLAPCSLTSWGAAFLWVMAAGTVAYIGGGNGRGRGCYCAPYRSGSL